MKILISPLDWGIGHATRIIPIINTLMAEGCEIIIASDGPVNVLLQEEFPTLPFFDLKGYKVKYAKKKRWLPLMILLQTPAILFSIYKEHKWLKKVVKNFSIDAVISDNRFGLYHPGIHCVYITHQLTVITGNKFSEAVLKKIHYWFIKRYTECWVPDFEGGDNVAGRLSHPDGAVPSNIKYIGCLSRFQKHVAPEIKYDLLVLLSGPEPQRTILEKILLLQLRQFTGGVLLVRGKPGEQQMPIQQNAVNNFHVENHLMAKELNVVIEQSKMVICRSGYTTIMDLIKLKKKAILIPTPGQTEQEYLARYLTEKKMFYSVDQDKFLLSEALENAGGFSFSLAEYDVEQYKKACHLLASNLS